MKQQQQTGLWLFGALVVAIVLAALAYFFLISPELEKSASANEKLEVAKNDNFALESQINGMKKKEQQVPEWNDEIGKISLDMPPTVEQPALERLINELAAKYDLPMVEVTYGRPEEVIPSTTEGYEPPTLSNGEEGATPSPSPSPEPSSSAEPSPAPSTDAEGNPIPPAEPKPVNTAPPFVGLVAIPVTVGTEGEPADVMAFMAELQTQIDRFYTATNFTITKADPTEEAPGRRALTEKDWTLNLSGMVFTLIDPNYSFPGDAEGEVDTFVPGTKVPNPFAPLPGTEVKDGA